MVTSNSLVRLALAMSLAFRNLWPLICKHSLGNGLGHDGVSEHRLRPPFRERLDGWHSRTGIFSAEGVDRLLRQSGRQNLCVLSLF